MIGGAVCDAVSNSRAIIDGYIGLKLAKKILLFQTAVLWQATEVVKSCQVFPEMAAQAWKIKTVIVLPAKWRIFQ
jgi:hypothetical protein